MANNLPSDEQSLRAYLRPKILIIVQTILENIKKSNVEQINQIVYGAGTPTEYIRTYQFRDFAWDATVTKNTLYETEGEFKYNPEAEGMKPHLSLRKYHDQPPGINENEYLAEIIYEGVAGHIFGEGFWTKPRDAWTKLVEIVGSDTMKNWIDQGARKARLAISWN